MSMIPPPYPFPQGWEREFKAPSGKWLTPSFRVSQSPSYTSAHAPVYRWHAVAPRASRTPPRVMLNPCDREREIQTMNLDVRVHSDEQQEEEEMDSEEEEYAFVLSDEWRDRFTSNPSRWRKKLQASTRTRGQQRATASTPQASRNRTRPDRQRDRRGRGNAAAGKEVDGSLQRLEWVLADASTRDRSYATNVENGKCYSSNGQQRIQHLEAQLNASFDAFCDRTSPIVWPAA